MLDLDYFRPGIFVTEFLSELEAGWSWPSRIFQCAARSQSSSRRLLLPKHSLQRRPAAVLNAATSIAKRSRNTS